MIDYVGRSVLFVWNWLVHTEGSTKSLALVRIALALNCWSRWGDEHLLFQDLNPEAFTVSVLFFVSSALALVGLFTRIATALLAFTTGYFVNVVGHIYGNDHYVHHHTTLLATACLLLALSPSGRSLSVDRWLSLRRWSKSGEAPKDFPRERANLWAMRLMALQVASVYFWGAYDKCSPAFLSGARMTHYLMNFYTGPAELEWSGWGVLILLLSGGSVLLEFALAFGLFFKKGRRILVIPGVLLHGLFYVTLPVATFSATMWALYFAVFDPEEVENVFELLVRRPPAKRRRAALDEELHRVTTNV